MRILLVVGSVEASAGVLSAQAAPASEKDTPKTPRVFLPRRMLGESSDERAMTPPPRKIIHDIRLIE